MFWAKLSIFAIGALTVAAVCWRYRKGLKPEAIVSLVVAVVLFAVPFLIDQILPKPVDPDYVALHRPYIEPLLIVDSIETNGVRYHYEIRNAGQLTAQSLNFVFRGPRGSGVDNSLQRRDLSPGGHMVLRPIVTDEELLPTGERLALKLDLHYYTQAAGKTVHYKSYFYFEILPMDLAVGKFPYDTATRSEGELGKEEQKELIGLPEALESPCGTHWFWFDKKSNSQTGVLSFVNTDTKSLLYDTRRDVIAFRHVGTNQNTYWLEQAIPTPEDQWHHVFITWTPTGSLLAVDAVITQYYGLPPTYERTNVTEQEN